MYLQVLQRCTSLVVEHLPITCAKICVWYCVGWVRDVPLGEWSGYTRVSRRRVEAAGGALRRQPEPGTQLSFIFHLGTSQEVSVLEEILCSKICNYQLSLWVGRISGIGSLSALVVFKQRKHWAEYTSRCGLRSPVCEFPMVVRNGVSLRRPVHPILTVMTQSFSYGCIIG